MKRTTVSKSLRERLLAGESVLGSWINSGSPIVAELMASCGFDFLCVDAEHSAVDLSQVQTLFQAITSGRPECAALVRLHGVDYAFVKRYLDAGADGVIAPLVRSRNEAEQLVQACKYPPEGLRGLGFCRANDYGMRIDDEYARANNNILIAVQIEHIDAVTNIDEILGVPGVDAVFIGPYDLSASMGIVGQFQHPDYVAALGAIQACCRKYKIVSGIHVVSTDPDAAKTRLSEGYQLLAYSLDITMISTACKNGLAELRQPAA